MIITFSPNELKENHGIVRTAFAWARYNDYRIRKISWDKVKDLWLVELTNNKRIKEPRPGEFH